MFIEVVTTTKCGRRQWPGQHGGFVYHYIKAIHGKTLHIIAELHNDECFFVTGYWA